MLHFSKYAALANVLKFVHICITMIKIPSLWDKVNYLNEGRVDDKYSELPSESGRSSKFFLNDTVGTYIIIFILLNKS